MEESDKKSSKDEKVARYVRGLRQFVEIFEDVRLRNTANSLTMWINGIVSNHTPSLDEYERVYPTFRTELASRLGLSPNVLIELERLLPYPTDPTSNALLQANDFLKEATTKTKVVNKILLAFRQGNLDQEQLFYGDCFIYLMLMEGVFDTYLSWLYAWSEASAGRDVKYEEIETARQALQLLADRYGVESLQQEYWNDKGHLRNSIAHARFSYDPTHGGLFQDSYKGKNTYNHTISLKELDQKVTAIFDLGIGALCLLIMRVSIRSALLDLAQS